MLEIAVGTQPFMDILDTGGSFAANGYNATLPATSGALGGRRAWSGDSGGWLITEVHLPPRAAGQNIQLRWRLATNASNGGNGWYIDDVVVSEYPCGHSSGHSAAWPLLECVWIPEQLSQRRSQVARLVHFGIDD